MKKIFLVSSLCIAFFMVNAQTTAPNPHEGHNNIEVVKQVIPVATQVVANTPENILAIQETHDFGKIPQGKPVTYNFEVTNTGKTAYKLDNVVAGCGCTTPQWDKEKVIDAGERAIIKVGFNAAGEGPFTKAVTITYSGNQTKVITIKGEVWKTPVTSAPANNTLDNFKN